MNEIFCVVGDRLGPKYCRNLTLQNGFLSFLPYTRLCKVRDAIVVLHGVDNLPTLLLMRM